MMIQDFEEYQKSRAVFAQTVAELAARPQNIKDLILQNVVEELEQLLDDPVPSIRLSATLALGRIMSHSKEVSEEVIKHDLLPIFINLVKSSDINEKKVGAYALRSLSKHSMDLVQTVIDAKGLEVLHDCLNNDDSSVREIAVSAIGQLAKFSYEQANILFSQKVIPSLMECIHKEHEDVLKRESLVALTEIAKHNQRLAEEVLDNDGTLSIAKLISHSNIGVQRQACACLAQIAKHGQALAQHIADEAISQLMDFFRSSDLDPITCKNAMICLGEIIKHDPELANKLNKYDGPDEDNNYYVAKLIYTYIERTSGPMRLPGLIVLKHYAAAGKENVKKILKCQNPDIHKDALTIALIQDPMSFVRTATAWTIGEISKYPPDKENPSATSSVKIQTKPIAQPGIHYLLLEETRRVEREKKILEEKQKQKQNLMAKTIKSAKMTEENKLNEEVSSMRTTIKNNEIQATIVAMDEFKKRAYEALENIMNHFEENDSMITLLLEGLNDIKNESTQKLIKAVLQRLSTLVRQRGECWKKFAVSGALKRLAELRNSSDSEIKQIISTLFNAQIETINSQYKDDR